MFRIGEFAQFTRVSVKMLRHYDEIGLLPPARVDQATGYRYYRAAQLPRLNRILLLRDLGFVLDDIARLVDGDDGALDAAYDQREAELGELLRRTEAQLRAVRARRQMLAAAGHAGSTDVVIRPVAAELVATLPAADDVEAAFYRLETYVRRCAARAARPPCALLPRDGEALVAVPGTPSPFTVEADLPENGGVADVAGQVPRSATMWFGRVGGWMPRGRGRDGPCDRASRLASVRHHPGAVGGDRRPSDRGPLRSGALQQDVGFGVQYQKDRTHVRVRISPGRSGLTAGQVLDRLLGRG
jgi:DNA-binding transcriptional MerR regulator